MPKPPAAEVEAGGRAVRVCSPDRVIYEKTDRTPEVTKLMVAEYFASVGRRPDARPARAADGAGAVAVRRTARDQARHRPAGREGRRVLPEAGAQGRARLPRERRGHLPVRPDRRRDLPDRDRGAGLVRPHGHAHLPPLAGTPRRRRPPRRAADRPRPPARYVVHRRRARRRRRPGAARGARPDRASRRPRATAACTSTCGSSRAGSSPTCGTPRSASAASWPAATRA